MPMRYVHCKVQRLDVARQTYDITLLQLIDATGGAAGKASLAASRCCCSDSPLTKRCSIAWAIAGGPLAQQCCYVHVKAAGANPSEALALLASS